MHVTCPSCKFGGTVRDDQIPPDGKEVYCPNCNVKFRIKRDRSSPAKPPQAHEKAAPAQTEQSEYLPVSCPICGFTGKLKQSSVVGSQSKKITCPSCRNPFTLTPSDAAAPSSDKGTTPNSSHRNPSTSCPSCGSPIQHRLPVCPSCGRVLTGTKIHCPSCKSANVGISSDTHNDGGSRRETTVFKSVSLTMENSEDIRIPLSCRDCGRTWTIKPALAEASEEPSESSMDED